MKAPVLSSALIGFDLDGYDPLAETFRNCYKSDTGMNPRGTWTDAEMQAYLDRRADQRAAEHDHRQELAG